MSSTSSVEAGSPAGLASNGNGSGPAAPAPILALAGVDVEFGGQKALSGVDLQVDAGERIAVIGASGAGKSTLFGAATRSVPVTAGRVAVNGVDVMTLSAADLKAMRQRVGVIYQSYGLVGQLSAGMNVALGEVADLSMRTTLRTLARGPSAGRSDDVHAALEQVALAERMDQHVADLSGGQQQRVAVARLLLQSPTLILADEPVSAVDPVTGARVLRALRGLAAVDGAALLVSVHNTALARDFSRIVALRDGSVIFDGSPSELDDDVLDAVYAETSPGAALASSANGEPPPAVTARPCAHHPATVPSNGHPAGQPSAPRADPDDEAPAGDGSSGDDSVARVKPALPRPHGLRGALAVLLVLGLVGISFQGTEFSLLRLFEGVGAGSPQEQRFVSRIPYHLARLVLNVFRSVPDILWALIFVVALGLGPFPGTLALTVHSAGVLGKLFSESLETVPRRPVDALRAIGATRHQRLLFAQLPQAAGSCVSLTLYQWECNIRSAAILGFVGAGGVGQEILLAMNLFDYPRVATLTAATIGAVLVIDRLSAATRRRLVN